MSLFNTPDDPERVAPPGEALSDRYNDNYEYEQNRPVDTMEEIEEDEDNEVPRRTRVYPNLMEDLAAVARNPIAANSIMGLMNTIKTLSDEILKN